MKDQSPSPPLQTEAQPDAQPSAQPLTGPVPGDLEDAAAEAPPEASTETAAGEDGNGAEPDVAPRPVQTPDPASEAPAKATGLDIEKLMARGTSFLEAGDLVSARGFFKLAAGRGSGNAAMLVGVTYDPGYLELVNVVGLRPNPEQAAAWYLKAIELDNEEAESRLRALKRRLGQSP